MLATEITENAWNVASDLRGFTHCKRTERPCDLLVIVAEAKGLLRGLVDAYNALPETERPPVDHSSGMLEIHNRDHDMGAQAASAIRTVCTAIEHAIAIAASETSIEPHFGALGRMAVYG